MEYVLRGTPRRPAPRTGPRSGVRHDTRAAHPAAPQRSGPPPVFVERPHGPRV
ncbi:hypothetical protein B005_4659 [Nocardiopsis alba ATCC BAA-2165]|uniref:Uncharacterized protein n=1 Tax=Nocardiopsis alba (strain ATCC BAA-2165 / BE74) TaxID=1205910 RepID=J7LGE1_NOCAA|nr:hypothetical protein B005_4659 [Nocardiopsis alba ATCC BAA-2165]